tara:strand:- start:1 stop:111 length:111 start_codon:yes stop_codon:yes gene_type:complete
MTNPALIYDLINTGKINIYNGQPSQLTIDGAMQSGL